MTKLLNDALSVIDTEGGRGIKIDRQWHSDRVLDSQGHVKEDE
jgi:hypothetical protein